MPRPVVAAPMPRGSQGRFRSRQSYILVTLVFVLSAVTTFYSLTQTTLAAWSTDGDSMERVLTSTLAVNMFQPGEVWYDTSGHPIQAHGGGILFHKGTYYWYGENKAGPTYMSFTLGYSTARVDIIGISCYTSKDLIAWKNAGVVLPGGSHPDLAPQHVAERPKVVYNAATRTFVMWLHMDTADYERARTGIATAQSPTGPFRYLGSFRPHGQQARDMTVFQDDDDTAYLVYTSEDNNVMHVSQLTQDYLRVKANYARALVGLKREAPAVFKHAGTYFMLTSACTGWEPNSAEVFYSSSMLGEWRSLGNPCTGASELERTFTYFAQPTHVLPLQGHPGRFIFMADQWDSDNLAASRYVWLPLWVLAVPPAVQKRMQQREGGLEARLSRSPGMKPSLPPSQVDVVVRWHSIWQLSDFERVPNTRYEQLVPG